MDPRLTKPAPSQTPLTTYPTQKALGAPVEAKDGPNAQSATTTKPPAKKPPFGGPKEPIAPGCGYANTPPPPKQPYTEESTFRRFQKEARRHVKDAMDTIAQLAKGAKDERVKFQASKLLLDLAYGRPATQPTPKDAPDPITLLPGDEKL